VLPSSNLPVYLALLLRLYITYIAYFAAVSQADLLAIPEEVQDVVDFVMASRLRSSAQ
jgi:hypothetical protein